MKAFETFREVDSKSGVENWRAYFTDDCSPNQVGDWMPKAGAPVGYGDTELEAIGDLCIKEDKRIKDAEWKAHWDAKHYEARLAPMTEDEADVLWELYECDGDLCFHDTQPCESLQDKGYVSGIRFDGPRVWNLTEEGEAYCKHYFEEHED